MEDHAVFRVAYDAFNAIAPGAQHLKRHEFKCAVLAATGWRPGSADLERLLGQTIPDDAQLTVQQLFLLVKMLSNSRDASDRLREVYQAFDPTGIGFIRREDAINIFANATPTVHRTAVEEVFDSLDTFRTGRVSCDAFMAALRGRLDSTGPQLRCAQ